ncbi:helix-turn-helix domain-containing protein [Bounagaea algeriensis]
MPSRTHRPPAASASSGTGHPESTAGKIPEADLTVRDHIRDRRLDRAWQLLTTSEAEDLALGELAPRVGFSSHTYFSRAFRNRFDMTPRRARQQFRTASH